MQPLPSSNSTPILKVDQEKSEIPHSDIPHTSSPTGKAHPQDTLSTTTIAAFRALELDDCDLMMNQPSNAKMIAPTSNPLRFRQILPPQDIRLSFQQLVDPASLPISPATAGEVTATQKRAQKIVDTLVQGAQIASECVEREYVKFFNSPNQSKCLFFTAQIPEGSLTLQFPEVTTSKTLRDFEFMVKGSQSNLLPRILNYDDNFQAILYWEISGEKLLPYHGNHQLHFLAMQRLKVCHETYREFSTKASKCNSPILTIENQLKALNLCELPSQTIDTFACLKKRYRRLEPWLDVHATSIHGNCNSEHVLYSQGEMGDHVFWFMYHTEVSSHPYMDPAKYCLSFSRKDQNDIFCSYLGKEIPSSEEILHFNICRAVQLMYVFSNAFTHAEKFKEETPSLDQNAIDDLLKTSTENFSEIPFSTKEAHNWQRRGIFALREATALLQFME